MKTAIASALMAGLTLVGAAGVVSGSANAQSLIEYCVATGGQIVERYNQETGNHYRQCQGGDLDGWIVGQPLAP
ncbi:hypothetical protein [Nocardia jejuensis]|uniref:hypothetical protein n=1 Tax=Nocardia jejuensis TaxID=328049 RepID=UPI000836F52B|nr:hypothetical protein [Nocardia jejuensis]